MRSQENYMLHLVNSAKKNYMKIVNSYNVVGVVWIDWLLRRSIPSDLCRSDYETTTCLLLGSETRMKQ